MAFWAVTTRVFPGDPASAAEHLPTARATPARISNQAVEAVFLHREDRCPSRHHRHVVSPTSSPSEQPAYIILILPGNPSCSSSGPSPPRRCSAAMYAISGNKSRGSSVGHQRPEGHLLVLRQHGLPRGRWRLYSAHNGAQPSARSVFELDDRRVLHWRGVDDRWTSLGCPHRRPRSRHVQCYAAHGCLCLRNRSSGSSPALAVAFDVWNKQRLPRECGRESSGWEWPTGCSPPLLIEVLLRAYLRLRSASGVACAVRVVVRRLDCFVIQ